MKSKLLNLDRTLYEATSADWSDSSVDMARAFGKLLTWSDVLQYKCSVVFGGANSGKTSELRLQADALRRQGVKACFVAVRELLVPGQLEDSLEGPEAEALQTWLKTPNERLVLLVDSIDEASLAGPRDLRICLRRLVERVSKGAENVTWILSTRPAVLNQLVIDAIDDALGVTISRFVASATPPLRLSDAADARTETVPTPGTSEAAGTAAKTFRLSPLTHPQALLFLEKVVGLSNGKQVAAAAELHGLSNLLTTPGKLKLLARLDLIGRPPTSLQETYRQTVALHLDAPSNGRSETAKVSRTVLEEEATRLACASTLCAKLNIELPAKPDARPPDALSARNIVPGLLDSGLQHLLSSDFFEDSGHQQVKLQPDDIRFYLCARRLNSLIRGREDALKVAQVLGWRAPSGERGIFAPFIPVAGWLASLNPYFRLECLELDPQCVAFFGDLRSLPVAEARSALDAALERIANGERIGRGAYYLTSENFWQAGAPSLLPFFPNLFDAYRGSEEARELLMDIARTVNSSVLRDQVMALCGSHAKVLEYADALQYVLAAGNRRDRVRLRAEALKSKKLSERSARVLIESCAWDTLDAADIATLLIKLIDEGGQRFSLRHSLTQEVGPAATTVQLIHLTQQLLTSVVTALPADVDDSIRPALQSVEWLAEAIGELLADMAQRELTSKALLGKVAKQIVQFKVGVLDRDDSNAIEYKDLAKALEKPSSLRSEVLRQLVARTANLVEAEIWRLFMVRQPLVLPTLKEARALRAKGLVKVLTEYAEAIERGRMAQGNPKPRRTVEATAEGKAALSKRRLKMAAGADVNALAWVAQVLCSSSGMSRYGDVSLADFETAYGKSLADAVRTGLAKLWRSNAPRWDESNPRSTYWTTIAGLQGLHLEFQASAHPMAFSKGEVQRALDYGLYEINGVPKWYWGLVKLDPQATIKFFRATLKKASNGAVSAERAAKVLTLLPAAPVEIRNALAPEAWAAVCRSSLDEYQTASVMSLLVEGASVSPAEFGKEASSRVFVAPPVRGGAAWAVNWLLLDSVAFFQHLEAMRLIAPERVDAELKDMATTLEDGRGANVQVLAKRSAAAVAGIKQLYLELVRVLPREQDVVHPPGKAYNVSERDRAQDLRDRLPSILASIHTTTSYVELLDLASLATDKDERRHLRALAFQLAEAMQSKPPMTEEDFVSFEQTLRPTPNSLEAFAQEVENDILDVRGIVENGEFSPRRFLSTAIQDVEAGVVKSMEDEFQLYLAGLLEVVGRNRYSVFREPQLAEDSRRDISVAHSASNWKVTLELKVTDGGWTVQDYRDSLRNQLVGLYMKERHTSVGFFVVLRQTQREWRFEGDLDYEGLLELLRDDAQTLEAEKPQLRLRVIGIDASEPVKPDGSLVRAKAEPAAVKQLKKDSRVRKVRKVAAS